MAFKARTRILGDEIISDMEGKNEGYFSIKDIAEELSIKLVAEIHKELPEFLKEKGFELGGQTFAGREKSIITTEVELADGKVVDRETSNFQTDIKEFVLVKRIEP